MEKVKLNNNFWKEGFEYNQIKKHKPFLFRWKVLFYLFLIGLVITGLIIVNFSITTSGVNLFFKNLKDFFSPKLYVSEYGNINMFSISFRFLWYSIKVIFLGTTIGILFAFITAYFSNYQMNNKYVVIIFKALIIFLRLFPELFFIYFFTMSFDKSLAINLIFIWFTWLWMHEYLSQSIENCNFTIFYHLIKIQKSKFKAFRQEIWPQFRIKFFNYSFYAFESNIRWSAILSTLGFGGIGSLINPASLTNYFNQILIPLT
ncbi:ABC transporter permease, partial [[Mycoplasma] falconis]